MFFKLFALFTLVPVLELALLITVGVHIGVWPTIAIVVVTGFSGAFLAKQQGFTVLNSIKTDLDEGILPAAPLLDGVFVLAGGLLLLTPGFVTDIAGLLCLIPPTRNLLKGPLKRWLQRHFTLHFDEPDVS